MLNFLILAPTEPSGALRLTFQMLEWFTMHSIVKKAARILTIAVVMIPEAYILIYGTILISSARGDMMILAISDIKGINLLS